MEIKASLPLNASSNTAPIKDATGSAKAICEDDLERQHDTVDLSQSANEIGKLTKQGNALPDVREDKVAEMKRKIAAGTYSVASDRIAGDLINETIENNTVLNRLNDNRD